jgi:hypothetical protein
MNRQEFLNQFNVLYNNETSNQAPGLNGYEISVFLTKAEYEVLKNYFIRTNNKSGAGFDDSPKRQIDFSTLLRTKTYNNVSESIITFDADIKNAMFILSETAIEGGKECIVTPISYWEYNRIKSKPYSYPLKRQVWRMLDGNTNNCVIDLIGHPNKNITSYKIKYVKKPLPIIVGDDVWTTDSDRLTIDGQPTVSNNTVVYPDIEIPEELHQEVLQRAVELAKIAWQGDLSATLTGGQRSE